MTNIDARLSGTFRLDGKTEVNRLGFGVMRVTGPGIWGEPADREECKRTLKRLPDLGITSSIPPTAKAPMFVTSIVPSAE